jgi:hypothetical protein
MATIADVMGGAKLKDQTALSIEKVEYKRDELGPYVLITNHDKSINKTYSKSIIRQLKNIQERGFVFGPEDNLVCIVREKESKDGNKYLSIEDPIDEDLYEKN